MSKNVLQLCPKRACKKHLSVRELDVLLFEQFAGADNFSLWLTALNLYRGGFLEMECYEWSIQHQMEYEIKFEILQEKIRKH